MKPWTRPSNYIGARWHGWLMFLGRTRDSDCLEISNFECALARVKEASNRELSITDDTVEDCPSVHVVSENHWAVGWVEWIAIHPSDTGAVQEAEKIESELEDYPVLDESDFSEREMDEANRIWRDCFLPSERIEYIRARRPQFDFRDLADMLSCVRGNYFSGYVSELIH